MRRTKAELVDEVMALRRQIREHEGGAGDAEAPLVDAISNISEGFVYFDAEGRMVMCNDQYKNMFSLVADKLVPGITFSEILDAAEESGQLTGSPDEVAAWKKERMAEHVAPSDKGHLQHLSDGRWIQSTERRTEAGGFVGIRTDVTELKEAQEQLASQKAVLEATLENVDQGISMVDKDLNALAFNTRFLELLEFPTDRFHKGDHFEDFIRYNAERGDYGPGDVKEQIRERVDLARKFEPHKFERTRPDGTVIEVRGNPVPGGGFVTTYTDITERKRVEEALRDSEERYVLVTQATRDALFDWDLETGQIYFPNDAKAALGLRSWDGSAAAWAERIHPDDQQDERVRFVAALKGEEERYSAEYRLRDDDGNWLWVHTRGVFQRGPDDQAVRMIGSSADITQRKRAEEALRDSEERYILVTQATRDALIDWDLETGQIYYPNHCCPVN